MTSMGAQALQDYRKRKVTSLFQQLEERREAGISDDEARAIYALIREHGIRPGETFAPQQVFGAADKENYRNRAACQALVNRGLLRLKRLSQAEVREAEVDEYVIGSRDKAPYRLYVTALAPVMYDRWALSRGER